MSKPDNRLFAIVADVGGTHIRFGAVEAPGARIQCIESFDCADFEQLEDAIESYSTLLSRQQLKSNQARVICLALPGDTQTDPVQLVNAPWDAHIERVSRRFQSQVLALNDFSAQAYAIPGFEQSEVQWLRRQTGSVTEQNRMIVGPGTGLGVAALLPGGQVVESEGGHISFAPQTSQQQQLFDLLTHRYSRVSVERLISGPGLANIYQALALLEGQDTLLEPEQITTQALAGDSRCLAAIELFTRIFGCACGDLALAFAAKGGVYLSGGLLSGLGDLFDSSLFLDAFDNKGRYRDYCNQMPVARVLSPQPGLVGAARFAELTYASAA